MLHYVKKLWRKNYRRKSRSVRIIASIIVTVIFLGAGQEVALKLRFTY